jgi:uncharacterized protein (DUF58 family)
MYKQLENQFLLRKHPLDADTITLNQKRIYILPSRSGFILALVLFAMLLGAINYNNSLAYALTFLLASVTMISMLHTWRNLYKLQINVGKCLAVHKGEIIQIPVAISNPGSTQHLAIKLAWPGQKPIHIDLNPHEQQWVRLTTPALQRGYQPIGKLVIYSRYPLGLFHAWGNLRFDQRCLVYPTPSDNQQLPPVNTHNNADSGEGKSGTDDFTGQRRYQNGDSLRHVNWKALAKERGLLTKQFGGEAPHELVLSWHQTDKTEIELRLSQLTSWVMQAHQLDLHFGLELPHLELPVDHGDLHYHRCLKALALYGKPE